jgi:glutamate synthase (NADPH/NADH) small chain
MTDPRGFLTIQRRVAAYRPPAQRRRDYRDVRGVTDPDLARNQARRCMDCGVPFCHAGCPLGNLIPDWCDLVERGDWRGAHHRLDATNNFPEFTGKLCPAPCEEACVLALADQPVTIKQVEVAIAEQALAHGWVVPEPPLAESGRRVAVVGSGPAGLAAAQQLRRAGHAVTVYERDDRPGGLLRYGIPDFKLEKSLVDNRLGQLVAEGVRFETSCCVGADVSLRTLRSGADAVVLATGAQQHRQLGLPGSDLELVSNAMTYLTACNRRVAGLEAAPLTAVGRRVVVIGGGDTSADCLGNATREGAAGLIEIGHGPYPPSLRQPLRTWPQWPFLLRSYAVHEEAGERRFALEPDRVLGESGVVSAVRCRVLDYGDYDGVGARPAATPTGRWEDIPADLVLVAIGFSGVEADQPVFDGVDLTASSTVRVDHAHATSLDGVFAAGDCVLGADLIVTAIAQGRACAAAVCERLRAAA